MKKNIHKLFAISALVICASAANAQVKLGSNPTVISPNTNLEVEATNGKKVKVSKDLGTLTIDNIPEVLTTPNFVLVADNDGVIRKQSFSAFKAFIVAGVSAGGGTVTSVSGNGPISVATGTTTPVISIATANATTAGALSSADWTTFNNKVSSNLYTANGQLTSDRTVDQNGKKLIFSSNLVDGFRVSDFSVDALNGRVGIGTTTPGNKLDIWTFQNGSSGLRLTNLPNAALLGTNSNGDVVSVAASSVGDNLGNHTATTTLNMQQNTIKDAGFTNIKAVGSNTPALTVAQGNLGTEPKLAGVVKIQNDNSFWGPSLILDNGYNASNGIDMSFRNQGKQLGYITTYYQDSILRIGGSKLLALGKTAVDMAAVTGANFAMVTDADNVVKKITLENFKAIGGDNLGNHTATTSLNMSRKDIYDARAIQAGTGLIGRAILSEGTATQSGYLRIMNASVSRGYIGFANDNMLYQAESGSNHIFSGGNVGIGTTTPGNKLDIATFQTGSSGLRFTNLPNAALLGTNANGDVVSVATSAVADNLGNHLATKTLDMQSNTIKDAGFTNINIGSSDTPALTVNLDPYYTTQTGNGFRAGGIKIQNGNNFWGPSLILDNSYSASNGHDISFRSNNIEQGYMASQYTDGLLRIGGRVGVFLESQTYYNAPNTTQSTYVLVQNADGIIRRNTWENLKAWILQGVSGGSGTGPAGPTGPEGPPGPAGASDNMGDHSAFKNLQMNTYGIDNANYIRFKFGNSNASTGFIGYNRDNIRYVAENGARHVFEGGAVGISKVPSPDYSLDALGPIRIDLKTTTGATGIRLEGNSTVWSILHNQSGAGTFSGTTEGSLVIHQSSTGTIRTYMPPNRTDGWQEYSDVRLKTNIKTLENVLDKLDNFRGVSYNMKSNLNILSIGVIAQEIDKSFPEIVSHPTNPEDFYGVSYGQISAIAIQAVKELKAKVLADEAEMKDLKASIAEMKAQIKVLMNK